MRVSVYCIYGDDHVSKTRYDYKNGDVIHLIYALSGIKKQKGWVKKLEFFAKMVSRLCNRFPVIDDIRQIHF